MLLKKGAYLATSNTPILRSVYLPRNTRGKITLSKCPSKRKKQSICFLWAQAEERMNLRKKMTFHSWCPPFWNPWLRLDVFMWSWDAGESMVYAEAQKGSLQASRLVHGVGKGRVDLGRWPRKQTGRPAVHTLHRPWGWWESDSRGSGVSSWRFWGPGLPFMAPRETCLWVQSQVTIVMPFLSFGWKPHTDPKGPDKRGGERRNTVPASEPASSSAFGSPGLLPWWNVLTSRAPKRLASLGSGMPVFKSFVFFRQPPARP